MANEHPETEANRWLHEYYRTHPRLKSETDWRRDLGMLRCGKGFADDYREPDTRSLSYDPSEDSDPRDRAMAIIMELDGEFDCE